MKRNLPPNFNITIKFLQIKIKTAEYAMVFLFLCY